MPRQQTFDGTELDAVLARVRREAGPDAEILSASKVRDGGVGGFFSRERFRVTVALPGDGDADAEAAPEALTFEPLVAEHLEDAFSGRPASLLELADLVDEAEADAAGVPLPQPAPEAPDVPVAAEVTPAPRREVAVPTVRPDAYTPTTESASFNSVLRRLTTEAEGDFQPADPEPRLPATVAPETARSVATRLRVPAMPPLGDEITSTLAGLGVPEALLPTDITPAAAVIAMLHSLQLPAAPPVPTEPGALTVVLGERKAAMALALDLAADAGLKRTDVKLADPEARGRSTQLLSPEHVAGQRAGWTAGAKIVAMAAPPSRSELGWAWDMLAELSADALWGVTGAGRKCEDVEAWSAALGGFDALALTDLDQTVSPAAMLRLGIPVARLDGRPATPSVWAELLTARVAV